MLTLSVTLHLALQRAVLGARHRAGPGSGSARRSGPLRRATPAGQAGQATAEYALVLLGVATVALLLAAWAAKSGKIGQLFDAVVDQLIDKVG